jgi:hypothetical protein
MVAARTSRLARRERHEANLHVLASRKIRKRAPTDSLPLAPDPMKTK